MKKILLIFCTMFAVLAIGCGNMAADSDESAHADSTVLDLTRPIRPPADFAGKRVLVAFFSRTGENFEVGVIEKGNTHIIAEQIAELTRADQIFEIKTVAPYPADYQEMTKLAKEEKLSSQNYKRDSIKLGPLVKWVKKLKILINSQRISSRVFSGSKKTSVRN